MHAGRIEEARTWLTQWSTGHRAIDEWDPVYGVVRSLAAIDDVLAALGDTDAVEMAFNRLTVLVSFRADGFIGLDHLRGDLALRLERIEVAEEWYRTGLAWAERERCPIEIGRNLQGLAALADHRCDVRGAAALLDQAAAQYVPNGIKYYLDQVTARKAALLAKRSRTHPNYPAGLSEREVEVLRLLALGRSNAAIAAELVIAEWTAIRHVSNILNKTGLSNRTEAAAFAYANGLADSGGARA